MLNSHILELIRKVVSLAPLVGLVRRPPARPEGITACVRVKGDEEWIEPSLISIQEFADEILVLDNGASPETQKPWTGSGIPWGISSGLNGAPIWISLRFPILPWRRLALDG